MPGWPSPIQHPPGFRPGAAAVGYPDLMSRLAVIAPYGAPSVQGNAVTVERVTRGLRELGEEVRVWDLSAASEAAVAQAVEDYRPAVVHAFHAGRTGPLALRLARRLEVPLVVTLTGTDANHDLLDAERAPLVRRVLEGAGALIVFHESIGDRIAGALPDLRDRLVTVPQAVAIPRSE